ncbi:MAG: ECF transporter S component, partial [Bacteroidales bacterium]
PPVAALPVIILKSFVLALVASIVAGRVRKVSIIALAIVVALYQLAGGVAEWGITGSVNVALQDFNIGLPGMILQVLGGYIVLKTLEKR